jgi:hypothetical protein
MIIHVVNTGKIGVVEKEEGYDGKLNIKKK